MGQRAGMSPELDKPGEWQLMATVQEYLDAYDRQLRTDAETPSAVAVTRLGPLRLVTFAGGRGFVTYRDLGGVDGAGDRPVGGGRSCALP